MILCVCKGVTISTAGGYVCSEKGQMKEVVTWSVNVPKKAVTECLRSVCVFARFFNQIVKVCLPANQKVPSQII